MTLLLDTEPGDSGLIVQRSEHWGYNAIAVVSGGEACVVDPGITRGEIESFRAAVERGDRVVTHVLLTHSHHDHIRGWDAFGEARVIAPVVVDEKDERARRRILAGKSKFDERIGEPNETFRYPEIDRTFVERDELSVGRLNVELRFLPGHSNCTSVVIVPELRSMLSADYLVTPGLPYCRFEVGPFEAAHREMLDLIEEYDLVRVVPAHNAILESKDAIQAAIRVELDYFAALREFVQSYRDEGLDGDRLIKACGRAMGERRGVDLGARARQDLDNAKRLIEAGLE